jgi:hypothetical protein
MTQSPPLTASYRVTLVSFTPSETAKCETALRLAGGSLAFEIRRELSIKSASIPAAVVHAIIFTSTGLSQVTSADVKVVRSATQLGTCRVYAFAADGDPSASRANLLDDFIQRTSEDTSRSLADQIIAFFREADALNRRNFILASRDANCLFAYNILKFLWPVSYLIAVAHILNVVTASTGHKAWIESIANQYAAAFLTFFGAFFVVHSIFVIIRNFLFGARIVRRLNFGFMLGAGAFGLASSAVAYSVIMINQHALSIFVGTMFALSAYAYYMYSRRIRAECMSLSELQAKIADSRQRNATLENIGKQGLVSSAFPLLSFPATSLFISYMHASSWSSETASQVHLWASKQGFEVFHDRSTTHSGTLWRQSLLRGVSECGFFVAVIDGAATETEWVLAESAYATLLRKSIGKPRIMLVVRNIKRISADQMNPFHVIYRDLFQLPPEYCYGASILAVNDVPLTEECFFQAIKRVRPMSLLS